MARVGKPLNFQRVPRRISEYIHENITTHFGMAIFQATLNECALKFSDLTARMQACSLSLKACQVRHFKFTGDEYKYEITLG